MAIKVKLSNEGRRVTEPRFPALRIWKEDLETDSDDEYGPLIVLFTSDKEGVVLSGQPHSEIGTVQSFIDVDSDLWAPCTIVMSSET